MVNAVIANIRRPHDQPGVVQYFGIRVKGIVQRVEPQGRCALRRKLITLLSRVETAADQAADLNGRCAYIDPELITDLRRVGGIPDDIVRCRGGKLEADRRAVILRVLIGNRS